MVLDVRTLMPATAGGHLVIIQTPDGKQDGAKRQLLGIRKLLRDGLLRKALSIYPGLASKMQKRNTQGYVISVREN
jgi:hypothetical protein